MSAYRIKCAGNLHQLGLATQMYWDDNAGQTFRYHLGATNNGDLYWFGWLEHGPEGRRTFDPSQGVLFMYLSGRGAELCPSLNYALKQFKLKATGAAYGYGYNLHLSPMASRPAININQLSRPAETVVLADAAQVNTFQAPACPEHPMLEEFYYVCTNEPTAHFRHQRSAMAVFCDGHVTPEKPAEGSLDTRLPSQVVGRLRTEALAIP
jgi:prepilin-type processing-associated H-X9-DG protein